jgi:glutathione-regulated potassium-efflux system ancillary protein KefC/glutathione-regulated potassium-efflux system protein KefB
VEGGFLREALVYLLAAVIAAPLFNRLKLGSVLGYLVAGVVIGPYLLNAVGDAEDAMHFAEFGVVILLFIIGLEVRPGQLWSLRTSIFGLGGAQVLGGGAVLAAAAMALGLDWRPAVAVGLILALSSTAIVLQTLEERGIRHTAVGRNAFSVLLLQDLAVIPLFALLPLLATLEPAAGAEGAESLFAGAPPWLQALATLSAVGLVLIGGRYLTRPVFRFIAETRLREIFTAATLLIVVAVTALMQSVGLSPALGAFLAGMVLGDSEYRREIETDIEPFRGLFLGLFFITIGAGMDLATVAREPLLIAGLTVGLLVLKGAVIFGLVRAFGANARDSGATAVALAQGGEFAFVLFAFSVAAGVLPPDLTALLTVVVALSMALTPLLVIGYARLPLGLAPTAPEREPDVIDETRPDAIVAGFGRFGQVVGRVLIANGYRTVVLESSAEQIELLRRFGRRVYYGDATRLDLLRAAGAEQAKVLVVAIDNRDKAVDLVRVARAEFPELVVIARAWDRRHAYQLQDAGAHVVERETFEGGLHMAEEALKRLGMRAHQAHRAARIFRRHDLNVMQELAPLWNDEERFVVASRESSRAMEQVLAQDLQDLRGRIDDDAWDVDSLYRELREEAAEEAAAERRPDPAQP